MVLEERTYYSLPANLHSSRAAPKRPGRNVFSNFTKATSKNVTNDCFSVVKRLLPNNYSLPSSDESKLEKAKNERKKKNDPLGKGKKGHRKKTKTSGCKRDNKMKEKKLDGLSEKSGKKIDSEIHEIGKDLETDNKCLYEKKKNEIRQKFDSEKVKKDNLESEKKCGPRKLKTEKEDQIDLNIFLEESGLDVNEFDADDDSTDSKSNKERKIKAEQEKSLAEKEPNRRQVLTGKNYGLENEGEEKLVVNIPASDNRYAEERYHKNSKILDSSKTLTTRITTRWPCRGKMVSKNAYRKANISDL